MRMETVFVVVLEDEDSILDNDSVSEEVSKTELV